MQATGIVRNLDRLGRVVIPIELRKKIDVTYMGTLEIVVDQNRIILKKYEPKCVFCGSEDEVIEWHGKHICKKCLSNITKL